MTIYEVRAYKEGVRDGAERKRRSIKRAIRRVTAWFWERKRHHPPGCPCTACAAWNILDAATRPRKVRK